MHQSNITLSTNKGQKMKSSIAEIPAIFGTEMDGGIYAGRIIVNGDPFAIILPPKLQRQHDEIEWNYSSKMVEGATSFSDGRSNTIAMSKAGSKLAQWALDMGLYIPAQDELEIIYRNLKPTTDKNAQYARSGINVNAIEPTSPYTPDVPAQTLAEAFKEGGREAFDPVAYWSSTQHAATSTCAWYQHFGVGIQYDDNKNDKLRGVAVRRLSI